ncbi:helix-turn-helix transcriptional regulator [uncultured Parolsenella sp.]|uniref:helix-turn-helix transcriptional regulator n=1 Tax=uncultured Parolsenella sp. TaxID=2083008 RepID=UPI0025E56D40|nr:helix-turn-helix transcriptional regulator [uncultured Parolsenella sp.]
MSFRDNLQHLRASRNMTQEQLAMLVGVSRQSVTKWEAERAYPEMDKLLKLCQIFDCSLDDLVSGDLTAREEDVAAPEVPAGPPTDVCGYDEHARRFAFRIATGAALFVLAVATSSFADWALGGGIGDAGGSVIPGIISGGDGLSAVPLLVLVAAAMTNAGPLEDPAGAAMLALWAVATWLIVYGSLMWGRINVAGYNRASLDGIADADIDASNLTDE